MKLRSINVYFYFDVTLGSTENSCIISFLHFTLITVVSRLFLLAFLPFKKNVHKMKP